jgi:hypothetical protein
MKNRYLARELIETMRAVGSDSAPDLPTNALANDSKLKVGERIPG